MKKFMKKFYNTETELKKKKTLLINKKACIKTKYF